MWFKNFCLVARSGYHNIISVAQVQVQGANTPSGIFALILKKVLNFLGAESGYQQPKSGSSSKFLVAWGYQATIKSYTESSSQMG